MKQFLTNIFIKAFGEQGPVLARILAGALTSLIVFLALKFFDLEISEADKLYINGLVTGGVLYMLAEISNYLKVQQSKEIQEEINKVISINVPTLKEDGKLGDKTVYAVRTMKELINQAS